MLQKNKNFPTKKTQGLTGFIEFQTFEEEIAATFPKLLRYREGNSFSFTGASLVAHSQCNKARKRNKKHKYQEGSGCVTTV